MQEKLLIWRRQQSPQREALAALNRSERSDLHFARPDARNCQAGQMLTGRRFDLKRFHQTPHHEHIRRRAYPMCENVRAVMSYLQ